MRTILTYGRKALRTALALALAAGLPMGCEHDEVPDMNGTLSISLTLEDAEPAQTRTPTDATDDEKKISKLDVYVFQQSGGTLVKHYTLGSATTGTDIVVDPDWQKSGYTENTEYEMFVIANSPVDLTDQNFATVEALKAFRITEGREFFVRTNSFLMDAHTTWTPTGKRDQRLENLPLRRAVAKMRLTVKIGDGLTTKMSTDQMTLRRPMYKAVSMAMNTSLTAEAAPYDPVLGVSKFANPLEVSPALNPNASEADFVKPEAAPHYVVEAYSYRFSWEENYTTKSPKMLVSFEFRDDSDETKAESERPKSYHYYLVPMVSSTTTEIESNKLYIAQATITSYGSVEEVVENVEVNVSYEVVPWGTSTQTDTNNYSANISAPNLTFLTVTPEKPVIYEGDPQTFKDVVIHYNASSEVEIENTTSYYYNKNGVKTTFENNDAGLTGTGSTGHYAVVQDKANKTITVRSMVPTNAACKYISFTVKMDDTHKIDMVVMHYPSEFVSHFEGYWSSRTTENWVEYGKTYNNGQYTIAGDWFYAKVNINGTIYFIQDSEAANSEHYWKSGDLTKHSQNKIDDTWLYARVYGLQYYHDKQQYYDGSYIRQYDVPGYDIWRNYLRGYYKPDVGKNGYIKGNYVTIHTTSGTSSYTNPMIYALKISSTKSSHTIGKPEVENNLSNDNVVSPAFMIASQLGALASGIETKEIAAEHCTTYKEVDTDNNVYTGWRLPTKDEISTIINYQSLYPEVMDKVLTGQRYWCLDGTTVNAISTGSDDNFVRCVRDLNVDEINRLLNKE